MIPLLSEHKPATREYAELIAALRTAGFAGDLSSTFADRVVLSTDNSIYQIAPQAIAFPRTIDDLALIAKTVREPRFKGITMTPRGGGTGTNGQSLNDGLIIDVSKHMDRILEINVAEGWVRVQAGVVKDQLNAALREHGLFFAPELSTSNRATIGGMISTDASGQGSCLYGKTRDHVLELTSVLLDGTVWRSAPLHDEDLRQVMERDDSVGAIHRLVAAISSDDRSLIETQFPNLNRCLTGYDLKHIRRDDGRFDLNSILCGSEGTLAILAEAKLNVLRMPTHGALVNMRYTRFEDALRDARALVQFAPASIETVDDKVLDLARNDQVWRNVGRFFPEDSTRRTAAVNLMEFVGHSEAEVEALVQRAEQLLDAERETGGRIGYTIARGYREVGQIWEMRKRAVGLLGSMRGEKRPVAFVEDTAVPPENLADYIREFRAALDRRGLSYGMFGHVDAGVLHVRPAVDLKDPGTRQLVREVTEEVVELTAKYGGLLWGEHGKGIRAEFAPRTFGPLYPRLQQIKAMFDPGNQLNPGKVVASDGGKLLTVDGVPIKGEYDRQIPPIARAVFGEALHCNGNGACHNWDPFDPMCPSWKGTRERRHSPKGRAQLIRQWLYQLTQSGSDLDAERRRLRASPWWRSLPGRMANAVAYRRHASDFSHEVKAALDGCLGCKSCSTQCPVRVDIPTFRSRFLEVYHGRYLRPARDYVVALLEYVTPVVARAPAVANVLAGTSLSRAALRGIGLVHVPKLSGASQVRKMRNRRIELAKPAQLRAMSDELRNRTVVIVQDVFSSYFESALLSDLLDLLRALGYEARLAPFRPNGKALHVHGFLAGFERVARLNAEMLEEIAATGVELIGIDPAMTLAYRSEYREAVEQHRLPRVLLVQEWLARHRNLISNIGVRQKFQLLPHCTERTTAPSAVTDWVSVFAAAGLELDVLPSGCCGMSGIWGHQAENRAVSEHIYSLSWGTYVSSGNKANLLADGYSCRSQAMLVDEIRLQHPLQALLAAIRSSEHASPPSRQPSDETSDAQEI
ncbi:MAG: FAD-binding oxidoreductase [Rhizobiaceae bacterium]|nr:FAD-binding oxidoreductase [Rhizobiaceae bacterium]